MNQASHRTPRITDIPAPAAFVLALVLSLLTGGLLFAFTHLEHVNNTTVALIFLLPVGISASLWGLLPGVSSAIVSFLAFNFFFIPDLYTFDVKQTEDLIVLVAFLGVAFVISQLAGRVRRNLESAMAREREAIQLYEFSTLLATTQSEKAAARVLLDTIEQTLRPARIELLIETVPQPTLLAKGNDHQSVAKYKTVVLPLQTTRDLIGEIRLWLEKPIFESDERLLKIFSNQSLLAIERIRLAEGARMARVLEESDRLKSSLLSSVSHELRSPLAAIKASVSSLRSGAVEWESEARFELLTTVEEEIDHLNVLVGNLLDMSRIEAGALKPQKTPNMLSEIAGTVVARIKPLAKNHNIVMDISDDMPLINVDYVQLQQVFSNLLTNSLKYAPPGSTIKISAAPMDEFFIQVRLTNQSMPVPEADLERIFEKFYRINPSDRVTGAGLGLSICKGLIEANGGKIWAENLVDGLAFNFTVTLK